MMAYAWLLPVLCLAAFILLAASGRRWGIAAAAPAVAAVGAGFALFWPVLADLLARGPQDFTLSWMQIGARDFRVGILVDPLALLMTGVVTLCSSLIQIYSIGYMRGDMRAGWFFAVMSLFTGAMLTLVLADNFLLLYMAWELVGLCSFLLIGFWYERPAAAEAAKKAFITTRIGDVGFLIGIIILWRATGSFAFADVFAAVENGTLSGGLLTIAALFIFLGAMGKSGQFPLHVWLPDAMEGPTPVSALIHAATMVAAGVYLVARSFPLFSAAPVALNGVLVIGLLSNLLGASLALVMTDIKRVLAYSTISQYGLMMVALGVGGYSAALFHLFTHAFFKALLFLGAGSVLHGTDRQDIRALGGLARRMPVTAWTFGAGVLALAGFPFTAGFWSKDEILGAVLAGGAVSNLVLYLLLALSAILTAIYGVRLYALVFLGHPRDASVHAHESPAVMAVPLAIFAALALLAGFLALPLGWPGIGHFGAFVYAHAPEELHLNLPLLVTSSLGALIGLAAGWGIYARGWLDPARLAARYAGLHRLLVNKYYLDDLYQWLIDHVALVIARLVALFDRRVVNDTGVDGPARATVEAGEQLRYHETGKVYTYAWVMAVGAVLLFVVLALR